MSVYTFGVVSPVQATSPERILRRSLAQTFDRDVGDYLGLLGMYEAATGTLVEM